MRKKLKIFTVALCSAAISLNMAAPYLHAEISEDGIDYKGLPIEPVNANDPTKPNYFPDEKFQNYLKNEVDGKKADGTDDPAAKDGYLSDAEIKAVKEINIEGSSYDGIKNVNGIEVFENLEKFTLKDVTGDTDGLTLNFYDTGTHTKTERYSNENAKLKYVSCYHSNVKEIKIDKSPELEYLNCSDNYILDTVDLSENTKLEYLYCSNTALQEPNLSKNTELKVLDCSYKEDTTKTGNEYFHPTAENPSLAAPVLKTLNLKTNAKLEYLDCSCNTSLTSLTLPSDSDDAAANATAAPTATDYLEGNSLKYIDCHECGLTALDLSSGTSLQYLNCAGNSISPSLDISKNTKLEYLDCSGVVKEVSGSININKVTTPLTLGNDSALRILNCSNNEGITTLNAASETDTNSIEYSTSLETLNCAGTKLELLDLSKNTALETLICEEQYKKTDNSIEDGTPSEIKDLKLNRLLYKKAGLSFNDIFGNMTEKGDIQIDYDTDGDGKSDDTNVDIYYTDNALDVINVVAKDVTKEAEFKEGSRKTTVTYTNLDGEIADLAVPDKDGDYTLANCTHLYKDINRNSVINGEPVIVYANGGSLKLTDENGATIGTKNSKKLNVYTDIAASYKVTQNSNGSAKTTTGKVIVGVTNEPTIPTVTNNRIDNLSDAATAKIKNGQVTVIAKNNDTNESGVHYLWIIDTGSNGTYECCPVNILVAPKKLEVRNEKDTSDDPRLIDATRMIGEELEVCIAGYADTAKTQRTKDSTYSWSVPSSVKDCVEIKPVEGSQDHFIIKAKAVKDNRDTKVNITFKCDQNSKKIKFTFKISAATFEAQSPAPSVTPGN